MSSLSLIFVNLITTCIGVFLFGFILYGTLHFLDLSVSFPMLGKFSAIISSNIFLGPFSLLLGEERNVNVGAFNVIPEVSWTVLILLILFSLVCSTAVISTNLSSSSLIHSSASFILLLIPSSVFYI